MKAKHQRLTLAIVAVFAVFGAVMLAISGSAESASYFRSPADIAKAAPAPGEQFRLGGMVADKSIVRGADGVSIRFIVADGPAKTMVRYTGITPDLFKENSGVVAEGALGTDGVFTATTILAKHDENYMPPKAAGTEHKTETLKP
jgi:cytochrome c-type biogenesis protein CcmE